MKNGIGVVIFVWRLKGKMCNCIYNCLAYSPLAQRIILLCEAMDSKKNPKKTVVLPPIRVSEGERDQLKLLAQAHGLKLSDYLRRAGLIQEVRARTDAQAIITLGRLNADLARLGNLFKLALDKGVEYSELTNLINDLKHTQRQIKETMGRL